MKKAVKKDQFIHIRINKEEKKKIQEQMKKDGFDSLTAYLLRLVRLSRNK